MAETVKPAREIRVAVVGQPNCGKTSLFNRLTGSAQTVGNWPGVTVEKKEGSAVYGNAKYLFVDLPGIYSMSTYTLEERITREYLLEQKPDIVLNIVDSTNLERQLFLTVQLRLLDIPTVLVLNMVDELAGQGLGVDTTRLSELLGVPVVSTVARNGTGVEETFTAIALVVDGSTAVTRMRLPEDSIHNGIRKIAAALITAGRPDHPRWMALKFLEQDGSVAAEVAEFPPAETAALAAIRDDVARDLGGKSELLVPDWIYGITRGIERETMIRVSSPKHFREKFTATLDRIALDRFLGIPVFLGVMFVMFQTTFVFGELVIKWLEKGVEWLSGRAETIPVPWLASLASNGAVGGVGNVILLLPYVVLMFLLMSVLEDSGYMARAAFVMDRWMHRLGLHGKSFIPLVMGFGCNVPAIMAARSLESQADRIKTVMMIPYMLCSARLAVFTMFCGAFFGKWGGLVLFALYVLSIVIGILTGLLLKKTWLNTRSEGLIMELPPYRPPHPGNSLLSTWLKSKEYLVRAGTLIFAISIVLWALSFFPAGSVYGGGNSLIGYIGRFFAPVFAPLGFDWRMTVSLLSGFAAKEVVISSLGVLYGGSANLVELLRASMTPLIAFSFMVFSLVYTPCIATVAIMRSETNSWKWTLFSIVYSFVLAWVLAFLVTNGGEWILSIFHLRG